MKSDSSPSPNRLNRNCLPTLLIATLVFAGLLSVPSARAGANLSTQVQMTGVHWAPTAGTLNWSSAWQLEAAASIFDSQNGFTNAYQSQIGQPATVTASAATPLVSAEGQGAVDVSGNILYLRSSLFETVAPGVALSAFSGATAYREFEITGGSGPLDVTFSFNYSVVFQGSAETVNAGYGFDYLASLRVSDGVNMWDLTANGIVGSSPDQQFGGTLSQSFTLDYDTPYSITLVKDNEIPEPGSLHVLALGLLLWTGRAVHKARRRRKGAASPDTESVLSRVNQTQEFMETTPV